MLVIVVSLAANAHKNTQTIIYDILDRQPRSISHNHNGQSVYQDTQYDAVSRVLVKNLYLTLQVNLLCGLVVLITN